MFFSKGKIPGKMIRHDDNPSSPKKPDPPRRVPKTFEYVSYFVNLRFVKVKKIFD